MELCGETQKRVFINISKLLVSVWFFFFFLEGTSVLKLLRVKVDNAV